MKPVRCSACHADAHAGFFARAAADAPSRASAGDCATCHTTARFSGAAVAEFDHARWTGLALAGAHARSECAACHGARAAPDANGRRFCLVAESFPGSPDDCATCHADAHAGFFARRPGAPGCASCHAPHDFAQAAQGFEHAAATGFVLDGAHARAACSTCHDVRADPASGAARRTTDHPGPAAARGWA